MQDYNLQPIYQIVPLKGKIMEAIVSSLLFVGITGFIFILIMIFLVFITYPIWIDDVKEIIKLWKS